MKSHIGTVIQTFRENANLTQQELADKIGLTRNYIALLEGGKRFPSDHALSKISQVLHVSLPSQLDEEFRALAMEFAASFLGVFVRAYGCDDKAKRKFAFVVTQVYGLIEEFWQLSRDPAAGDDASSILFDSLIERSSLQWLYKEHEKDFLRQNFKTLLFWVSEFFREIELRIIRRYGRDIALEEVANRLFDGLGLKDAH
jgi:transcriptional regulator with XRE-family HTH domain